MLAILYKIIAKVIYVKQNVRHLVLDMNYSFQGPIYYG